MNMAPLPINGYNHEDWGDHRADERLLSEDGLPPLPKSPTAPEASEAKRRNRSKKSSKSSRTKPQSPLSPISASEDEEEILRRKEIIDYPYADPSIQKEPTPPPPPLSSGGLTPPTPRAGKSLSRNKSISNHRSPSSRSISNRSRHSDVGSEGTSSSRRMYRRPRKKLVWNQNVRVQVIHNLSNYTPQEKLDCWFMADEYSMMEDECELTSIHMDEIAFEEENMIDEEYETNGTKRTLPDGFCERGLESWTMQGEEIKEHQVQLVIDTVWQAQIDAWECLGNHPSKANEMEDIDNIDKDSMYNECSEFIRERATEVSTPSVLQAHELALRDKQAVEIYLNSVRSLENSRRRIRKMLGGKHSSSRSVTKSSRTLATAKSSRTLTTVSSSGSRSAVGADNLKSILKSPKPKRHYSDPRSNRRSPSLSPIPLNDIIKEGSNSNSSIYRIALGNDSIRSNSLRSKSLRSNSLRSRSNRSNRSSSLRSNLSRNNSLRSHSARSNSVRSNLSRSNSLRSMRSNSLRSHSLRSHGNSVCSSVSGNSLSSNGSKKKIRFKPKSKTKIPTSPVGSVCSSLNLSNSNHKSIDEESLSNRMARSHMSMSLGSEGSSRRRMRRASTPSKPPL